jgi:hypothetical protein
VAATSGRPTIGAGVQASQSGRWGRRTPSVAGGGQREDSGAGPPNKQMADLISRAIAGALLPCVACEGSYDILDREAMAGEVTAKGAQLRS